MNGLLNLINNQPDIDKIHLYTKDPYQATYKLLINETEKKQDLNNLMIQKILLSIHMIMQVVFKNINEYNADNSVKY